MNKGVAALGLVVAGGALLLFSRSASATTLVTQGQNGPVPTNPGGTDQVTGKSGTVYTVHQYDSMPGINGAPDVVFFSVADSSGQILLRYSQQGEVTTRVLVVDPDFSTPDEMALIGTQPYNVALSDFGLPH